MNKDKKAKNFRRQGLTLRPDTNRWSIRWSRCQSIVMIACLLVLAACGGGGAESSGTDAAPDETGADEAASSGGLECAAIEWVVPYSPGGGSDQQMRRLTPHLEESLGVSIQPVYRTGGAGSVGWQSVADAEPDGCTVGTAVYPDMALQTVGLPDEDRGFRMDSFTYLGFTEAAPNALFVAPDSEYETLDELVAAAEESPGSMTFAGSGEAARLVFNQIQSATDTELSYVPTEGGVGDIVPTLMGGHVDMGVGGAHHVVEAYADTTKALAVAGSDRVPALSDVPTFDELGYDGVTVSTVWGLVGPEGVPDDIVETWNDALLGAVEAVEDEFTDLGLTALRYGPDEAREYILDEYEALLEVVGSESGE